MSNHAEMAPISVPGVPWGPSGAPRSPESSQSTPKGTPRAPFGSPRGVPRATKSPQRAPKESPRALLGGLGRGKIEKKSVAEANKVDFSKSAPRLGPADARSTSDPLKSLENQARAVQSRSLTRLSALFGHFWSLKSTSGALNDRLGSTPTPQGGSQGDFLRFP